MSETPGFENRCEKTLNEGRHVCLQARGHEGECQPNVNAPWPPVPATPLDVEACVRLLDDLIRMLAPHDAQSIADANLLRALASALPGMGKATEENESLRRDAERWRSRPANMRHRRHVDDAGQTTVPRHEWPHVPAGTGARRPAQATPRRRAPDA